MVEISTKISTNYDLTKNFTQKFEKYFTQNKKLNKLSIFDKIECLINSLYEKETSSHNSITDNINIGQLENCLKDVFCSYRFHVIGSVMNHLVTNSLQRDYTIDILSVQNEQALKDETLRNEIITISNEMFSFCDENEEKIKENSFNLKLSCLENGLNVSVRIFNHQNDLYYHSYTVLASIFKEDIYKKLHVIVQTISLTYYQLSWSRFHISCLIAGFLVFKFPDGIKRSAKFCKTNKVRTNKILGKMIEKREEQEIYWFEYEEGELNSFGSCTQLMFEFLDFIKRVLLYYKFIITKISNPKSELVFKNIEDDYLDFFDKRKVLEDKNYLFNLNFLVQKMKEKQQISFYQPKTDQISKLLYALIENYEKLEDYGNVIEIVELILK